MNSMVYCWETPQRGTFLKLDSVTTPILVLGSFYTIKLSRRLFGTGVIMPFDPGEFLSCEISLPKNDGTFLTKSGALSSQDLGQIAFDLDPEETALLKIGYDLSAQVKLFTDDFGTDPIIYSVPEFLSTQASSFTG